MLIYTKNDFAFPGHRELARAASDDGKEKATPTREINGPGPTALCGSVLAAEQRRQHFYIQFVKPQKLQAPTFPLQETHVDYNECIFDVVLKAGNG